jgi:hypothetical protein
MVLNAEVTLVSADGERSLALAELLQGPGQTAIGGHEVIHHVGIERPPPNASSIFPNAGSLSSPFPDLSTGLATQPFAQAPIIKGPVDP